MSWNNIGKWIEKKNPLKQGLKHRYFVSYFNVTMIEKKNPLKQGLKLQIKLTLSRAEIELKRRIH